jgi:hypothetical protein
MDRNAVAASVEPLPTIRILHDSTLGHSMMIKIKLLHDIHGKPMLIGSFFASKSPAAVVEHDAVLGFPTSHETPILGSSHSMAAPPDAEALYDLKIE